MCPFHSGAQSQNINHECGAGDFTLDRQGLRGGQCLYRYICNSGIRASGMISVDAHHITEREGEASWWEKVGRSDIWSSLSRRLRKGCLLPPLSVFTPVLSRVPPDHVTTWPSPQALKRQIFTEKLLACTTFSWHQEKPDDDTHATAS